MMSRELRMYAEQCRQDNSLLWDPPMESSFMGQSVSLWLHYFGIPFYIWNLAETSEAGRVNTWNFKSVPNLIVVISLNPVNSGDSNGVIHVSIPALGDENRSLPCFCLLALPQNPLRVLGHIINRWKGMNEEIAAPLESWETVW